MNKAVWWIVGGAALAGTVFWLWWRQKDAVPPSAVPIMAQARVMLANGQTTGQVSMVPSPQQSTDNLLAGIIPGYIPLTNLI